MFKAPLHRLLLASLVLLLPAMAAHARTRRWCAPRMRCAC